MSRISFLVVLLLASAASAQSPVPTDAKLEKIATGFSFVEGPLWKDGALLFSDISASKIYRWDPVTKSAAPFLDPSYNSNGLTLDAEGNLVFCQMGYRRVVRMDSNKNVTPLASTYDGKKFNSPNDLVVMSDGSIFFTDPDYNVPAGQKKELSFCGIYRISPSGDVQLLDSTLQEPNGICFSPDETKLYVNDSGKRIIYMWEVVDDSIITGRRVFATMVTTSGNADGMKTDSIGNIFSAGPLGIWVFSPNGAVLDTILVPGQTTNCNWGDADRKTLYITAGNSVYRIRLASTPTGIEGANRTPPQTFRLYSNYPNPFNTTTNVWFRIAKFGFVSLKVYNVLGQETETLVNEVRQPGSYTVRFDGGRLPSGIYFCRMSSSNFVGTEKMMLLK